jgi:hypothetical protein
MGRFNFSGLSDAEVDDILELKADLEADALWLENEMKKDKILRDSAAGQAAKENEEK